MNLKPKLKINDISQLDSHLLYVDKLKKHYEKRVNLSKNNLKNIEFKLEIVTVKVQFCV